MRRSALVTLLLLVGFAVISVTVWNLSGCSKGGKGEKAETGPEGITLELAASSSQALVFRNIELTATLKNAYNMPIGDERVVFWLVSKTASTGMMTPLYGGPSEIQLPRGSSVMGQQRELANQSALAGGALPSGVRRPSRLDSAGVSPTGRTDVRLHSVADGVQSAPQTFPGTTAPAVIPLAQAEVALDQYDPNTAFGEGVTDSMGTAGIVVTSETLMNYVIEARYGDGTRSNGVSIRFVPNPSYRCSLSLSADKTVSYTGSENPVTITARLLFSEEPVVGQELTFTASTTTGGSSVDVHFEPNSFGRTNSSGEVVVEVWAGDMGTFNICADSGDFKCPSGTEVDTAGACRYIDFTTNICDLELTVVPNTVRADAQEEVTATAVLTMNSLPLANEQVTFSLDYDKPATEGVGVYFTATNSDADYSVYTGDVGTAVVKIRSYGYADVCSVTVTMANPCEGSEVKATDSRIVTFTSNECLFVLNVDKGSTLSDGAVASEIQATGTLTFNGAPVASKRVALALLTAGTADTPFAGGYFAPNRANTITLITDSKGEATVKFGSTEPGECTLYGKVTDFSCPGLETFLEDRASITFSENQCEMIVDAVPSVASSLGEPVTVTASLKINGNPFPSGRGVTFSIGEEGVPANADVKFQSSGGRNAKVYTNANGVAQAVVTSNLYVGPCEIKAVTDGDPCDADGSAHITFKPNECDIGVTPDKPTVRADGVDSATLRAGIALNGELLVQAGIGIKLSVSLDNVKFAESDTSQVTVYTGADGVATATLKSYGTVGECIIAATTQTAINPYKCPGSEDAITNDEAAAITFQTNVCLMTVNVPASAKADGKDVTATATITINGAPVQAGVKVVFEATLAGVVFSSGEDAYTNQSGVATAKFNSSGYTGLCTITAKTTPAYPCPGTSEAIEGSSDIIFEENDCAVTLTIEPMVAKADGSEVNALAVLTMNGEPVAGQEILFAAYLSGVKFSKSRADTETQATDALGQALVQFYSDGSTGDCLITAITTNYTCLGTSTKPSASETMKFEPEDYSIELTAVSDDPNSSDGSSAAADGLTEIQLTAVLKDKNGLPVGGANITFGCENGCIERYGSPIVTTPQGVATTQMMTSVMLADDTTGPEEDVSIWADYAGPNGTHRQSISYRFRKIRVASVFASDYSILEDGSVEATFGASVMCSDNRPVSGVAVELASLLGIFPASGVDTVTWATDNQGKASSTIVGRCVHGESTESARIVQGYCDYGNMNGMTPPVFWTSTHMKFEEGGAGCYQLKFAENLEKEVCFKSLTEDEEGGPYEDQCFSDVWVCLTKKADGSPVIGKTVTLYIHSFSNSGAVAFFNGDRNLQSVTGKTDSDGCINAHLDVTGSGRVLLRAKTEGFGIITANTMVTFGRQFCTRVSISDADVTVGEEVSFQVWGGCSKSYHWWIDGGSGGIPASGILGEYESFPIYWTIEGGYTVNVCDDYDDCVSAYVQVAAAEQPTESASEAPARGGTGLKRWSVEPTPTPAPGKK
ncbi:MAG: hypothetical protein JW759_06565 [Candidatus Coatesbacteria bacterium]|nr:hypothetical protein [Candidatus Coatesbacteria bacterium]